MRPRHSSGGSGGGGVAETVLVTVSVGPSTTVTLGSGDATSDGCSDEREWHFMIFWEDLYIYFHNRNVV
jgi:hypothetical protein